MELLSSKLIFSQPKFFAWVLYVDMHDEGPFAYMDFLDLFALWRQLHCPKNILEFVMFLNLPEDQQ
jgi:hypothetical protein